MTHTSNIAAPVPTGANCAACQDTGAVILDGSAVPCSCAASDYEWAAQLNRAKAGCGVMPKPRRGVHRNWQDREAQGDEA